MNTRENTMKEHINTLADYLNLNEYQANKLKTNFEKYNINKLQKRGGVLYVPYAARGLWGRVAVLLFGRQADLIGENKVLLHAQRNIKFCQNGFHSVRVGRYVYYADSAGQVLSKDEFFNATRN